MRFPDLVKTTPSQIGGTASQPGTPGLMRFGLADSANKDLAAYLRWLADELEREPRRIALQKASLLAIAEVDDFPMETVTIKFCRFRDEEPTS